MRHICSRCRLTSADGNLWCQEVDCPAGTLPLLFKYGDYLGNLKILELMRVLRTATIYKAERGIDKERKEFLLKIANPGKENETYLVSEAQTLRQLTNSGVKHRAIPVWRPHGAVNGQDAHGIATFHDQTRFYFLMDYVEGEFMTDWLLDNPLPWHEHAGWFMITLAESVAILHKAGKLHLNLNPDAVLVRRNNAGVPQPVLMDLGLLYPLEKQFPASEVQAAQGHLMVAYTPPELIVGGTLTPQTDVYGLGVLLYEMLAGKPAHPYMLRRTEDIHADIQQGPQRLRREDLPDIPRGKKQSSDHVDALINVVERAVRQDNPKRYQSVPEFREALHRLYGKIEDKYRFEFGSFFKSTRAALVALVISIFVLFVMVVLISALVSGSVPPVTPIP